MIDTQTQSCVHLIRDLGHVASVMVASAHDSITALACADKASPEFGVHSDVIMVKSEGGEDWRMFYMNIPQTKVRYCGLGEGGLHGCC